MTALDDAIKRGLEIIPVQSLEDRTAAAQAEFAALTGEARAALIKASIMPVPAYTTTSDDYAPTQIHDHGNAWPLQFLAILDRDKPEPEGGPELATYGRLTGDPVEPGALTKLPLNSSLVRLGQPDDDHSEFIFDADGHLLYRPLLERRPSPKTWWTVTATMDATFPPGSRGAYLDYPLEDALGLAIAELIRFHA